VGESGLGGGKAHGRIGISQQVANVDSPGVDEGAASGPVAERGVRVPESGRGAARGDAAARSP
jgi:hypothetical protein